MQASMRKQVVFIQLWPSIRNPSDYFYTLTITKMNPCIFQHILLLDNTAVYLQQPTAKYKVKEPIELVLCPNWSSASDMPLCILKWHQQKPASNGTKY